MAAFWVFASPGEALSRGDPGPGERPCLSGDFPVAFTIWRRCPVVMGLASLWCRED